MEPTGGDLMTFFDYAANKGLMKKDWASTLKGAAKSVLSTVEPDAWETMDLQTVDLDSLIQRFERLRMTDLKPGSLNVYGQRTRTAIAAFQEFLASPSTWQYKGSRTLDPAERSDKKLNKSKARASAQTNGVVRPAADRGAGELPGLITYPYPLRPNVVLSLGLPADLTQKEVQRLSAFLHSLAMDEQRALPPAREEEGS